MLAIRRVLTVETVGLASSNAPRHGVACGTNSNAEIVVQVFAIHIHVRREDNPHVGVGDLEIEQERTLMPNVPVAVVHEEPLPGPDSARASHRHDASRAAKEREGLHLKCAAVELNNGRKIH